MPICLILNPTGKNLRQRLFPWKIPVFSPRVQLRKLRTLLNNDFSLSK